MAGMAGRRVGRLTARQVETIRKPGLHGDGGNLFLKVDDGGAKSWMFRHQVNGRVRKYGLGPTHTVSLSRCAATCRDDPQAVARRHRPAGGASCRTGSGGGCQGQVDQLRRGDGSLHREPPGRMEIRQAR